MQVIPVLDIRGGRAVHARGGDRAHYGPLRSVLHPGPDPAGLARAGRDLLGLSTWYVADLDALSGARPDFRLIRALSDLGLALWVDAGLRDRSGVAGLLDAGAARLVAGLETVAGPGALAGIIAEAGPDRVAFSLDLRDGRPMVETAERWGTADPSAIAALAVAAGAGRIIHLDVGRVGTGRGAGRPPDVPGASWVVGGGISGPDELRTLARSGVAAALVGSALHDGRIGRADLGRLAGGSG
ncbi:HisA/HisF-related TIM barrel protein [Tundrisphaera sp. TA3]|uniref:HisA/HisF-related TIM barrel protein n=1 Tax=Tundrisphaera sp. TA3 TaxID=3435775 RepID=UPI003EBEAACF